MQSGGPSAPASFVSRFIAPGTAFTLGNPTAVNFSAFQNGTFDGAVEFQITSGRANIFRVSDELDLDRALSPGVASGEGFWDEGVLDRGGFDVTGAVERGQQFGDEAESMEAAHTRLLEQGSRQTNLLLQRGFVITSFYLFLFLL